jgi:flagellar motor switch protein FliG
MPSSIPKHALRKAAILVASLDPDAAERLLEQMPSEDAQAVRSAALRLDDVSESEQERVALEFMSGRRSTGAYENAFDGGLEGGDGGVELAPSLTRHFRHRPSTPAVFTPNLELKPASNPRRFAALDRASVSSIAQVLASERPQTAALVLSNIAPQRAADVLAQWPEAQQSEVFERIARLEEPDPEFVDEIEKHLEHALRSAPASDRTPGLPVAAAILQKANPRLQQALVERLTIRDARLATSLAPQSSLPESEQRTERVAIPFPRAASVEPPPSALRFAELASLDNRSWLAILGDCDPHLAVLALAGADGDLVDRILKSLPRKERKRLRREMDNIGPLRLRDVERAQQRIALRAAELAAAGAIPRFGHVSSAPQLAAA